MLCLKGVSVSEICPLNFADYVPFNSAVVSLKTNQTDIAKQKVVYGLRLVLLSSHIYCSDAKTTTKSIEPFVLQWWFRIEFASISATERKNLLLDPWTNTCLCLVKRKHRTSTTEREGKFYWAFIEFGIWTFFRLQFVLKDTNEYFHQLPL